VREQQQQQQQQGEKEGMQRPERVKKDGTEITKMDGGENRQALQLGSVSRTLTQFIFLV